MILHSVSSKTDQAILCPLRVQTYFKGNGVNIEEPPCLDMRQQSASTYDCHRKEDKKLLSLSMRTGQDKKYKPYHATKII